MKLSAGTRLRSAVCDGEVIIVKAPADVDVDIRCGGVPMTSIDAPQAPRTSPLVATDGMLIGKRYVDDEIGLQVLCTKTGQGDLAVGDVTLPLQEARALPASD